MSEQKTKYCEQPAINLKCVIFSLLTSAGYWYLPARNKWMLIGTLYLPYLLMAWYDHYFDCRRFPLRPTYLSLFYYWFKPKDSTQIQQFKDWCPEVKRKIMIVDSLVLFTTLVIIWKLKGTNN